MDLDLDRTLATLNEAPDYKINNDAFSGRERVRAFYADLFTGFPDFNLEVVTSSNTRWLLADGIVGWCRRPQAVPL